MSTHLRRARRILAYEGVPAGQVAQLLQVDTAQVRNDRRALGRDPEVGGPATYARLVETPEAESFQLIDSLMRSNRSVCG